MKNLQAAIVDCARELKLLTADGQLKALDSLEIIDFVIKLEQRVGKSIPTASLTQEAFASLEAVTELLTELD